MGGRGMLVGRRRGQGNGGQGNGEGSHARAQGGGEGGKQKTRAGRGRGGSGEGVLERGSAFAFAAGGVVAGFVAAFEGVVGVGVVEFLVIGHVFVLAAVVVVLTGAVGGVIDT